LKVSGLTQKDLGLTIEGLGAYSEGIESLLEMDLVLTIKGFAYSEEIEGLQKGLVFTLPNGRGRTPLERWHQRQNAKIAHNFVFFKNSETKT